MIAFNTGLLANAVGFLAIGIKQGVLLRKTNRFLLPVLALTTAIWSVHYFLIGSYYGAAVHVLAAISILTASFMRKKDKASRFPRWTAAVGFSFLAFLSMLWLWHGPRDIVALVGTTWLNIVEYMAFGRWMRFGFLLGDVTSLTFALLVGSIPGVVVSILNMVSNGVGVTRMLLAIRRDPASAHLEMD